MGFRLACQVKKRRCVHGLNDRPKSSIHHHLNYLKIAVNIKKKLKEGKQGWTTTKQVINEM